MLKQKNLLAGTIITGAMMVVPGVNSNATVVDSATLRVIITVSSAASDHLSPVRDSPGR